MGGDPANFLDRQSRAFLAFQRAKDARNLPGWTHGPYLNPTIGHFFHGDFLTGVDAQVPQEILA